MQSLIEAVNLLPHGPEFRFVDRLIRLERGKSGASEYVVRGSDSPLLRGHFPGDPIFPGVLLIEAGAQLAGIVGQSDEAIAPLKNLRLTAVNRAKITGTARPGDCILLEATVTARLANLFQATVTATVNGGVVFRGDVTLSGDQ